MRHVSPTRVMRCGRTSIDGPAHVGDRTAGRACSRGNRPQGVNPRSTHGLASNLKSRSLILRSWKESGTEALYRHDLGFRCGCCRRLTAPWEHGREFVRHPRVSGDAGVHVSGNHGVELVCAVRKMTHADLSLGWERRSVPTLSAGGVRCGLTSYRPAHAGSWASVALGSMTQRKSGSPVTCFLAGM